MKTFTKSVVALMAMSTVAYATDLPSKSQPKAPAPVASASSTPFFVGVSGGSFTTDSTLDWSKINNLGVRGGYEVNTLFRAELAYDYNHEAITVSGHKNPTHLVATNGVAQYKFGPVTPYALAGVGYRMNKLNDEYIFNVGGGVRYDVAKNFEADLRYRYVADFDRAREDNILSAGFNYKF